MGRGFGRGAKSVAIVTHAQVKRQAKVPKGLRGRKRRRAQYRTDAAHEQEQLEKSMGVRKESDITGRRTIAQEIASVSFPTVINKRQKGFKQLRKQLLSQVKALRRKHHEKARKRNEVTNKELMAEKYRQESRKAAMGNRRRRVEDVSEEDKEEECEYESN